VSTPTRGPQHTPEQRAQYEAQGFRYVDNMEAMPPDAALTLTRRVPAHTRTETADWCKREFLPMSEGFRQSRARMRKVIDRCYWCEHVFIDGEMMALAHFAGKTNKVLCQSCAGELLASQEAQP